MAKILSKFAILLLIVLVGIFVYLQYFINLNNYKSQIQDPINKGSENKIYLEGNISWNLFPLFTIHVDKINTTLNGQKISASNISLYPKILPLLNKDFIIKKMNADIFGGKITASFGTNLLDTSKWHLNASSDNLKVSQVIDFIKKGRNFSQSGPILSYLMSPQAELEGVTSFKLKLNSVGTKEVEYLKELDGDINISINNISYKLKSINPLIANSVINYLSGTEKASNNLDYSSIVLSQKFNSLSFKAKISDGILNDDLDIYTSKYNVQGLGSINLITNKFIDAYKAYLYLNKNSKILLASCSGSLDNPQCETLTPKIPTTPGLDSLKEANPEKILKNLKF